MNIIIRPHDIFTFYYLEYFYRLNPDPYDREVMNEKLMSIAEKYLKAFGQLLYNQLVKYSSRERYDAPYEVQPPPENSVPSSSLLEEYQRLMETTYRSDMVRRNDRWNKIAKYTVDLAKAYESESYFQLFQPIDNLNNAIHNTKTRVMDKFPNGRSELIPALNLKFKSNHPSAYKSEVDRDILRLRLIENFDKREKTTSLFESFFTSV